MSRLVTLSFDFAADPDAYFQSPGFGAGPTFTPGAARTGIGAWSNAGAQSTYFLASTLRQPYLGAAVNTTNTPGGPTSLNQILCFGNIQGNGVSIGINSEARYAVETIAFLSTPAYFIPLPVFRTLGVYDYVEISATPSIGAGGNVWVQINGFPVKNVWTTDHATGDGTNVTIRNVCTEQGPNDLGFDYFAVMGGGLSFSNIFDDIYCNSPDTPFNNNFSGPIRIAALFPTGDGTPLNWIPSSGSQHFSLINVVAFNDANNVASNVVNTEDEYTFSAGSIPAGAQIQSLEAIIRAFLNQAGARAVAITARNGPSVNIGNGNPLSTGPKWYRQVYDTDPITNAALTVLSITANEFGEEITA